MKTVRLAYPLIPNAGDLLNEYICRDLFGVNVKSSYPLNASFSAIGSGLGSFQYSSNRNKRILQNLSRVICGDVHVWGTGFVRHPKEGNVPAFYRRNMIFHALRGNLTKACVEGIIGKKLDIPICDGGILTSMLFEGKKIEKRYQLGIIPHYREQDAPVFEELHKKIPQSTVINLREDPMGVYRKIAECELVISSSLHGLIISDSFHIPNLHLRVTNNLWGDGFKFMDYYSAFGIKQVPFVAAYSKLPEINDIIDSYHISNEVIERKKDEMYQSFPFPPSADHSR